MTGFDIFAIALVLLVCFTLYAGVKTVPQGYDWTIERFGKFTRTMSPGLNIIIPYFDRVGRKMNMMEQVISIPEQEVITKDNATVTVDGVAFYQVFDAAKASYEVSNLNQAIIVLTMTNIRSVMGAMDLDQVLSHRDEINERLLRVVDAAVSPWGLKVNRIEIKDIVPPADLVEAMGRQMKAERVKRADILQAEGQRQSEILRAEGAKQGQILQAEGRREAAFRDAEARERSAEAEAKATQMVSEAIAKGDVAALNYFIADKYIKAFGQLADSPNQKIIMLPIEAMSILGSLAGIGEIAKATFGESAVSAQAAARRASVPLWRRMARSNKAVSQSNPFLNKRADALVGRVFTLEKPIIDGSGTVRIDDTISRVARPGMTLRGPYATPARRISWRCTIPTGLLASVTIRAVIFEELRISSASLASRSREIVFGFLVITSSTSAVIRSERMWRRKSPSVTMPTIAPRASVMPTQPKPFDDISTSASDIRVPSGLSGTASLECMRSRANFSMAPSLPPGCSTLKSTDVKPRPSKSAIASESPSASIISDEVVGARLCGQASRALGSVSATSAALARVESHSAVIAISGMRKRLA